MLHDVASARRVALLELTQSGFLEKEKTRRSKKREALEGGEGPAPVEDYQGELGMEPASVAQRSLVGGEAGRSGPPIPKGKEMSSAKKKRV